MATLTSDTVFTTVDASSGNALVVTSFVIDKSLNETTGEGGRLTGEDNAESPFFLPTFVNPFFTNGDGRDTFFSSSSLLSLSGAPRSLISTKPPFFLFFALNTAALAFDVYELVSK